MGFACLLCLSIFGAQGVDFFDSPEYRRYQQQFASLTGQTAPFSPVKILKRVAQSQSRSNQARSPS